MRSFAANIGNQQGMALFREGCTMQCERCGNEYGSATLICPRCGMVNSQARGKHPSTNYGSFAPSEFSESNEFSGYQQGYQISSNPQVNAHTSLPPHVMPPESAFPSQGHYLPPSLAPTSSNMDKALIAEIILSLFGIFGVGWIMAGETTLGAILIVCSFFIYWPIMILGTAFTIGLGLLCLAPLAIAAIIINAILLNARLNRNKTQHFFASPQSSQTYTQHMHYPHQ